MLFIYGLFRYQQSTTPSKYGFLSIHDHSSFPKCLTVNASFIFLDVFEVICLSFYPFDFD